MPPHCFSSAAAPKRMRSPKDADPERSEGERPNNPAHAGRHLYHPEGIAAAGGGGLEVGLRIVDCGRKYW
ncbi:MAG: hypothetical protein KF749_03550 [Bacteroidetes bacterium]|nr:hypothetical protein [Bacteroidota bacterium]MCW5897076.1 hypothetical protein [Bacteroidota bacterium]